MKKVFGLFVVVLLITSCKTVKNQTTYHWEGKQVSKRKYDLLVYNYTVNFVETYTKKEDLKTFENLEVVYDTVPKK